MVKVYEKLGQSKALGLNGRPPRPIGALGSSKIYRVSGDTVLCYPLIFSGMLKYVKGPFNNHVDIFLPLFDHPPTPSEHAWTFS